MRPVKPPVLLHAPDNFALPFFSPFPWQDARSPSSVPASNLTPRAQPDGRTWPTFGTRLGELQMPLREAQPVAQTCIARPLFAIAVTERLLPRWLGCPTRHYR